MKLRSCLHIMFVLHSIKCSSVVLSLKEKRQTLLSCPLHHSLSLIIGRAIWRRGAFDQRILCSRIRDLKGSCQPVVLQRLWEGLWNGDPAFDIDGLFVYIVKRNLNVLFELLWCTKWVQENSLLQVLLHVKCSFYIYRKTFFYKDFNSNKDTD